MYSGQGTGHLTGPWPLRVISGRDYLQYWLHCFTVGILSGALRTQTQKLSPAILRPESVTGRMIRYFWYI